MDSPLVEICGGRRPAPRPTSNQPTPAMNLTQYILWMQFPVVVILIALSFQAAKSFSERPFRIMAFGWLANLGYLIAHLNSLPPHNQSWWFTVDAILTLTSSALFWYAGVHNAQDGEHESHWANLSRVWIVGLTVVVLIYVPIILHYIGGAYPLYLLAAFPRALFHFTALTALSQYLKRVGSRFSREGDTRGHIVYRMTTAYAYIQWLGLLQGRLGKAAESAVGAGAFGLGGLVKFGVLLGMVGLIGDAARKLSEERAIARQTKRTVERMGHELGTPVSQMLHHVEEIQNEAGQRGRFAVHAQALGYALQRVEAILMAAKDFETFRQLVTMESARYGRQLRGDTESVASLNALIEIAVMAIRDTREEKVVWSVRYVGNLGVRCQPADIVQVFVNILRNACDAMPSGKGRISIRTEHVADSSGGSGRARAVISDDGEGIAAGLAERIFEDGVTTRFGPGRGHGLAIVKELIMASGGEIVVGSAGTCDGPYKTGTVVVIELPRVRSWAREKTNVKQ